MKCPRCKILMIEMLSSQKNDNINECEKLFPTRIKHTVECTYRCHCGLQIIEPETRYYCPEERNINE